MKSWGENSASVMLKQTKKYISSWINSMTNSLESENTSVVLKSADCRARFERKQSGKRHHFLIPYGWHVKLKIQMEFETISFYSFLSALFISFHIWKRNITYTEVQVNIIMHLSWK